jgi:hypothetical protein
MAAWVRLYGVLQYYPDTRTLVQSWVRPYPLAKRTHGFPMLQYHDMHETTHATKFSTTTYYSGGTLEGVISSTRITVTLSIFNFST